MSFCGDPATPSSLALGEIVMKVLSSLAFVLVMSTVGGAGIADAGPGGNRGSLAGKVFYIEALIVSSPSFPEYEGATILSCFTFEEDGSFIDLEWPGEGLEPIPGVWVQHTEFPFIQFTAFGRWPAAGWTLVEHGFASLGEQRGKGQMTTYATVLSETNEIVFYLTTKGHAVETCPL
jgi:hypothetical protein